MTQVPGGRPPPPSASRYGPSPTQRPGWGTGRIVAVILAGVLALVVLLVGVVLVLGASLFPDAEQVRRDADGQVVEAARVDRGDVRPGDCVNDAELRDLQPGDDFTTFDARVHVVPCVDRHDFEVFATFRLPERDYAVAGAVQRAVDRGCVRRLARDRQLTRADLRRSMIAYYLPTDQAPRASNVICMLQLATGAQLPGRPAR